MPPHIKLSISQGPSTGREYLFDDRTTCIVGRAPDCTLQLPDDAEHQRTSRHHCLLDINPPDIRVRDFGSRNGTHVNGKSIGQRPKGQSPSEGAKIKFPEHDLQDGDEIKLGNTVFRVELYLPATCSGCSSEIAEDDRAASEVADEVYRCSACRALDQTASYDRRSSDRRTCTRCGRDVSHEVGKLRKGDYVCKACKANPLKIARRMLDAAKTGQRDLAVIEGYSIVRELGRGGMGAVYLARHEDTGEQVALKVMLPAVAASQRAAQMFLRETENTKALHHDRIVRLRDSGCFEGVFFFTLDFCDAGSIAERMEKLGRNLSPVEAGRLILQALDALEYAHCAPIPNVRMKNGSYRPGKGLVHRDLKPDNIFLCRDGRSVSAKIGDFGLAKAFDLAGLSGQTCSGDLSGTPYFMPREQVRNFRCSQPSVDLWAVAATMYFMMTGAPPREFRQDKDVWQTILVCDAVPIRKREPKIPKPLAKVIDAALVEQPRIGFQSASEFRRALDEVL